MKLFARFILVLVMLMVALAPGIEAAQGQTTTGGPVSPDNPMGPGDPPVSLFLPVVNRTTYYAVSGHVVDPSGKPASGVTLVASNGAIAISDSQGFYRFPNLPTGPGAIAPSAQDTIFAPAVSEFNLTAPVEDLDFTAASVCTELVGNGGFETVGSVWTLSGDSGNSYHAGYNSEFVHSGKLAVRTGITNQVENQYGYSFARQQVSIPAGSTATLRMWLYTKTNDDGVISAPVVPDAANAFDAQYVLVLDTGNNLLESLMWTRRNDQQWSLYEFNLSKWAGKTIRIEIGSYNDGLEGITSMWVDDVSISSCTGGVTPPGGCYNGLANSGFEGTYAWTIPVTKYTAGYSTSQSFAGARSMRTGIVYSTQNTYSYSDAWQYAYVPANATSAKLTFYHLMLSSEPTSLTDPALPTSQSEFGNEPLAEDAQYVLIIDEDGVIHYPFWRHQNNGIWQYAEIDLMAYKGQDIRIQFGTYNNGTSGVTAMYIDEMVLDLCTSTTPPPSPSPSPTPLPGDCIELFTNNGFESDKAWLMPSTAFTAGYSTFLFHKGDRSMRTGIYYRSHNRYSYSDAYQQVFVPDATDEAVLSMWVYPRSTSSGPYGPEPANELASEGDVQYILILDKNGNWIDTLLWTRSNTQAWSYVEYDLSHYAGDIVRVQFGSYNDGYGAVSALYVDDASLVSCP